MGSENSREENEEDQMQIDVENKDSPKVFDVYDCPHCDLMFPSLVDVEGHISIQHEDLKEKIVRCSECKKVLPNDQKAIKHHMIDEHIKPKQKTVVIDATPKNDHLTKPNNRYQISLCIILS